MGPDIFEEAQSIASTYSLFYDTAVLIGTFVAFVVASAYFYLQGIAARIAMVALGIVAWGVFVGMTRDRFIMEDIKAFHAEGLAALSQEQCTPVGRTPFSRFKAERLLCEGGTEFRVLTRVSIPNGPMMATFFKQSRTLVEAHPAASAPAGG